MLPGPFPVQALRRGKTKRSQRFAGALASRVRCAAERSHNSWIVHTGEGTDGIFTVFLGKNESSVAHRVNGGTAYPSQYRHEAVSDPRSQTMQAIYPAGSQHPTESADNPLLQVGAACQPHEGILRALTKADVLTPQEIDQVVESVTGAQIGDAVG
jgi:hypothetical protein